MPFTLQRVVTRSLYILRKGLWQMVLVTVVFYAAAIVLGFVLGVGLSWLNFPPVLALLSTLLSYAILSAQVGAVTEIALLKSGNKPVGTYRVLRNAVANALPLFFLMLLFSLGWAAGTVFLIVPGAIFATVCSLVVPAFVGDRTGILGAFRRSEALTKGHRWGIFGIWFVLFIAGNVVVRGAMYAGVGTAMTSMMEATDGTTASLVAGVAVILAMLTMVAAIFVLVPVLNAGVYVSLKEAAGDVDSGEIEKIFE